MLINKGANVNLADKEGNTPLHLSSNLQITEGNSITTIETTKLLLQSGGQQSCNAKNHQGNTPLHIIQVPLEKSKLLIEHQSSLEAVNVEGKTPFAEAVKFGASHHIALFLKGTAPQTVISCAQIRDSKGNTMLHNLIRGLEYEAIEQLLSNEEIGKILDLNATNHEGDTVLHKACNEDWDEGVELFISKGANLSVKNQKGQTALDIAIENNSIRCLALLFQKQPPDHARLQQLMEHRDSHGNSLLHIAVSSGSLSIVGKLLDLGLSADLASSQQNEYSDSGTPLHLGSFWKF